MKQKTIIKKEKFLNKQIKKKIKCNLMTDVKWNELKERKGEREREK